MKQVQSLKAMSRLMALTGLSPVVAAESTRSIQDLAVLKALDSETLSTVTGGQVQET